MLTVGSLFSGIGGLELGLERAGMEVRWQVEIEEYPRRVLAKHWPDVPKYEDVRDVGAHNLEPVDLICGGFPCQDISYAGKGAGLEGERSGLWYEFARVVREMGPRYVLVENVPALLTRGLDAVLGTLAESGYDAEWDCIPAAAAGAPHRRDRAFVVAYADSAIRRSDGRGMAEGEGEGRGEAAGRALREGVRNPRDDGPTACRPDVADADSDNGLGRCGALQVGRVGFSGEAAEDGFAGGAQWAVEPDVGRVADGVPARVDRLRALGNAVVPQVAEWIGRRIMEAEEREANDLVDMDDVLNGRHG